jgi:hypothetical protein
MITVYFETDGYAEVVATFATEQLYLACLPVLEQLASKARMTVTESVS